MDLKASLDGAEWISEDEFMIQESRFNLFWKQRVSQQDWNLFDIWRPEDGDCNLVRVLLHATRPKLHSDLKQDDLKCEPSHFGLLAHDLSEHCDKCRVEREITETHAIYTISDHVHWKEVAAWMPNKEGSEAHFGREEAAYASLDYPFYIIFPCHEVRRIAEALSST